MTRAVTELRASMTPKRLVTFSAMLACLLLAAPATATDSGGAAVESYEGIGGGIVAPAPEPADPGAAPVAQPAQEAAQEETPTTPEGGEQPEGEENGEQPPSEEDGGSDGEEAAGGGGGGGESADGSLPRTGLELAALSAIGLGLLLAGGALWPTGSWPPPRGRLSRSTTRR